MRDADAAMARARAQSDEDGATPWYVAEGQRAQQLLERGQVGQATEVFKATLAQLGAQPSYARAVILGRLARCSLFVGQAELAVGQLREALDVLGRLAPSDGVKGLRGTLHSELGDALRALGRYGDARKAYEAALKIGEELRDLRAQGVDLDRLGTLALAEGKLGEALARHRAALHLFQQLDPTTAEVWREFGILAEIAEKQAATVVDSDRRAALQAEARDYRQLALYAPQLLATLTRLGEASSYARAVILGRLGRCFGMARRPDLAVAHLREAIGVTEQLSPSHGVTSLRRTLHSDLGDVLRAIGQAREAQRAYEAALRIAAESRGDEADRRTDVTLHEQSITDYVLDTDLLIDGPREHRIIPWIREPASLPDHVRPMLPPCARTLTDDQGAVRFCLPLGEPILERHPGCTVMQWTRREVAISWNPGVLWRLIREMDGTHTVAEILAALPPHERAPAARMLAVLAATGAVDVSGRPVGRFLHSATKKGVLPGGGLEGDEVLRLASDGNYRVYPGAPQIPVGQSVPERLRRFHTLTRSRRSYRDYLGLALRRDDFDAVLHTACGVTGRMPWAGREVKLRAYPSSGALYAVEVYPVVFRVDGLDPAVYHYRPVENVLEVVRPGLDPGRFVDAALPMEREMLAGAAAMFCLVGCFPRHEQKYGEGGYRMLVAEAGHISQNLILAATALGLSARPFGGVFDDLVNEALGLDPAAEQFLLAVLVGHASLPIRPASTRNMPP